MSAITQCPACGTRFKVGQEQLDAYHGMVRCGRCQTAFNALERLQDTEPSPQLDLPIAQEEDSSGGLSAATATHAESLDFSGAHAVLSEPEAAISPDQAMPAEPEATPSTEEEFLAAPAKPKRPAWPWAVASAALLLLLLLAQGMYFFRVELAARMPGLKPALVGYCGMLGCNVPLPQDADLMSIDSSDLEADPEHANLITLTATLRNHGSYAQAYPDLELTLNDINDKPVARRTFHPAEYLPAGESEKSGLAGRRETNVKLGLDTADLKPSGYRLLLFYPPLKQ